MDAIILAGGFGTRLQSVVADLPKPMAPVNGKPFLSYLLSDLQQQGVRQVFLAVHYLKDAIIDYFGDYYNGMQLHYVIEDEPLGTGGAIANVIKTHGIKEAVLVLNGDTYLKFNYQDLIKKFEKSEARIGLVLREVEDCSRYGQAIFKDKKLSNFKNPGESGSGLINAGTYLINPDIFDEILPGESFSFEEKFLYHDLALYKACYLKLMSFFIDIGIPKDYYIANELIGN